MKVELITRTGCMHCNSTKQILNNHNIEYTERVIGEDISRDEVKALYPDVTKVPIILVNSTRVEGPAELRLLLEKGQLEQLQ